MEDWVNRGLSGRRNAGYGMIIAALAWILIVSTAVHGTEAPGEPGVGSSWTTGAKQGVGTSVTLPSKIWYTIGEGITHEVYYPQVDRPNVQDLQFIVSDGSSFADLERDTTHHQVQLVDPQALIYRQINTAKSGKYRITKTYLTDPDRSTLLIETRFQALSGGPYQLYALYNPSLNNSGMGDTAASQGNALVASDGDVASALTVSGGFVKLSNGYSGKDSDGLIDLSADKRLDGQFDIASSPGNIVQIGQINVGSDTTFTLALGFGGNRAEALANAQASLATPFTTQQIRYADGWHSYLASLKPAPASVAQHGMTTQYNVALMALKAHEDKTYRGANVASLSTPWGQAKGADRCCSADMGGYQAVWARDLYQVATALIAAGDTDAAKRSLDYLLTRQQNADGSFPHNSRADGSQIPGFAQCGEDCLQLDEAAFPILLAWQLDRTDGATWARLKKAADFIVSRGPSTPQERWEENRGFSPSTIAAEIAGLVAAADIAQKNGDSAASVYLAKADEWQGNVMSADNVEKSTFTTTGPLGDGRYYLRLDDNRNPNDGQTLDIRNGGGSQDERRVVDAGFLELVRLGVKPANDARIAESLPEVDAQIKMVTPNGDLWYRYNFDGYGEKEDGSPFTGAGIGRLWPLLSGERGEYELANGRKAEAQKLLDSLAKAANDGYMIPEQVWDRPDGKGKFSFGEGTDSATPLAWSMAQFVRLAQSIDAGFPVEMPAVVACRYAEHPNCPPPGKIVFNLTVPANTDSAGMPVSIAGELHQFDSGLSDWDPAGLKFARVDATHWRGELNAKAGASFHYKYTLGDWTDVEKDEHCGEIPNRGLTSNFDASGRQVVNDTVKNWASLPPCGGGDVQVTFKVTVPNSTAGTGRSVHIAGTLDKLNGNLPAWNPAGQPLNKIDEIHWQITLHGKPGAQIEYKYTLGDWAHVEKSGNCGEIPNRKLTLSYTPGVHTVVDAVENWRNIAHCGQ